SQLAAITTYSSPNGVPNTSAIKQRQRLVLTPAQFSDDLNPDDPAGILTLFDQVSTRVFYSTGSDWKPPVIGVPTASITTSADSSTATISVSVKDDRTVQSVYALIEKGSSWSLV